MEESGFIIPSYVGAKQADAIENPNSINIDGQENVWLSAIKLAFGDFLPAVHASYSKKVSDAARRYGILEDITKAGSFVEQMNTAPRQICTELDWKRTKSWLEKNAEYMDEIVRVEIVDHLFEKAAEMNYVPTLSENCVLYQIASRDPITPEVQQLAEESIHKLASGTHYTTDQFEVLPFEEVKELLPDLVKRASFNMPVFQSTLFAKAAEAAGENSAVVLDALFRKYGQAPIYDENEVPIEINDAILARL
jgi:pyruvoyl-dependent arginine decarboxylase (PvlArgDC)